ncbi:hypothetical protein CFII64_01036 [Pseudomonas sp. CFII64]|nr:hypothetical protein CFII64_01036 [Pseudomonas sp. CFII64]
MIRAQDVKAFILGPIRRIDWLFGVAGALAETFGEICKLQKSSFFSIGHSFAALAFVVSEPKMLTDGRALFPSASREPLCRSICIA